MYTLTRILITTAAVLSGAVDAQRPGPQAANRQAVGIKATPVPLNPEDRTQSRIGAFVYAGGLDIAATNSRRVRELSDFDIREDNRLVAVSDEGSLFEARLVFDASGRLTGMTDGSVAALLDEHGRRLRRTMRDAEGLAVLPQGDWLVSFERVHRIWQYPAGAGPPRAVPSPDASFPDNEGLEALTLYAAAGDDDYLAGSEAGAIWHCRLTGGCERTSLGAWVPAGLRLTAMASYGGDGLALLTRSYTPADGNRISVRLLDQLRSGGRLRDELKIAAPLTRDNFEGIAVVARPGGALRLYLLSDDNGSKTQRTYLLAFDWPGPR